jgi:hypothetical protein
VSGDPNKASLWADADVYVGPLTAANPATVSADFPAEWGLVGLLDGEAGFVHARSEDENDFFAWGGVLVRTSRRNFKQTSAFTALEDNPTTRSLIWPGSTATALFVPRPVPIKLALEKREGARVHRLITTRHAVVKLNGDVTESEADLTKYELLATIFPTGDGQLWTVQDTDEAAAA